MESRADILAFSQSEKIKAGLIWATQLTEMAVGMPESEQPVAGRMLRAVIGMVANEIHLGKKSAPQALWAEVEKNVDLALVMIDSGVTREASYHLSQALSRTTTIGQKAMTALIDRKLL
jgi:hypothetical protein